MAERISTPAGKLGEEQLRKEFDHFKSSIVCENFDYIVDGLMVRAFYVAPKPTITTQGEPIAKKNTAVKKLLLIIFNRGGNGDFGASVFGFIMMNFFPLAEQGFVVVGSQYRRFIKNIPNSGEDEFGGKDVNDVLKLVELAPLFPQVDSKKIGMYGFSRGGMMTYMAVKQSPKISAIAVAGGVVDLSKELAYRPEMENVYRARIPDYDTQKVQALTARSAINWIHKIPKNVPILLLHGGSDEQASADNARMMARRLDALHRPHKLVIYEGDDHAISIIAMKCKLSWLIGLKLC